MDSETESIATDATPTKAEPPAEVKEVAAADAKDIVVEEEEDEEDDDDDDEGNGEM